MDENSYMHACERGCTVIICVSGTITERRGIFEVTVHLISSLHNFTYLFFRKETILNEMA